MTIAPDEKRVLYPVFLPEWLETTRTSRMVVNGVTKIADPKGRERFISSKLVTRIGFLPTGALLKLNTPAEELEVASGEPLEIPVSIARARELQGSVQLELVVDEALQGILSGKSISVPPGESRSRFPVSVAAGAALPDEAHITVRATGQWLGHPVVSEASVIVVFSEVR